MQRLFLQGRPLFLCIFRYFGWRNFSISAIQLCRQSYNFTVLVGISIPSFFLECVVLIFSVQLRWFPVSVCGPSMAHVLSALISHLTMPVFALAVVATGVIARLSRSAMLEVLRQDFVRTARAKGVPERSVVWRHALAPCRVYPV